MENIEPVDKIATLGFIGSFATYYTNVATGFINEMNLNPDIYNWTVGGLPEFFTGLLGVRLAKEAANLGTKVLETQTAQEIKEKLPKTLDSILENVKDNSVLYSTIAAGAIIMSAGTVDETIYNWSNGTQDVQDIFKYAAGVGIGSYFNLKKD